MIKRVDFSAYLVRILSLLVYFIDLVGLGREWLAIILLFTSNASIC